jgi:serine/threonine protein kinase
VVIDDDGQARLSGLGLGVLSPADDGSYPAATEPVPLGEYLWMAPELLRAYRDGGDPTPTPASDMYSFGLLAYKVGAS